MHDATHSGSTSTSAVRAERPTPLPLRNDTLLGVCEAIGRDLGFPPNVLRIAFALGLFVSPVAMIAAYLGLGAVVAVTRWLMPDAEVTAVAPQALNQPAPAEEEPQLPLAA